jgi:CHAT domain-containing protein
VDDVSISYAPSLRVYLALSIRASRTKSPPDSILALAGAMEKRGTFQALDQVNREIEHIARLYPKATVVKAARLRTMSLTALPARDVFHFAGHAIVNDEYPWLSYLLLTNDAAPRRLTMTDIRLSGLARSRLVFLSACSTAQGRDSRGEGALSLARPFLAAGASAVVATLQPVEDRTMAAIATRFHAALRRVGAAKALREAQLSIYSESRPAQWAAVTVTGA